MVSPNEAWVLQMDHLQLSNYKSMIMTNIVDPKSWKVVDPIGIKKGLDSSMNCQMFFSAICGKFQD